MLARQICRHIVLASALLASSSNIGVRMASGMASRTKSVTNLDDSGRRKQITVDVAPGQEHTATVIVLHGLGDTCDGWIDAVEYIWAKKLPHAKFVVPTAPTMPVTLNMGMRMPAWYDIESLSEDRASQTCAGIEESRDFIKKLIAEAGVPRSRVALVGFSQGGAMSLFSGLHAPATGGHALGAVAVLSGYMPKPDRVERTSVTERTPVHFFHGDDDDVVRPEWGEDAWKWTKDARKDDVDAAPVKRSTFPGLGHGATMEELTEVCTFLEENIGPIDKDSLESLRRADKHDPSEL